MVFVCIFQFLFFYQMKEKLFLFKCRIEKYKNKKQNIKIKMSSNKKIHGIGAKIIKDNKTDYVVGTKVENKNISEAIEVDNLSKVEKTFIHTIRCC